MVDEPYFVAFSEYLNFKIKIWSHSTWADLCKVFENGSILACRGRLKPFLFKLTYPKKEKPRQVIFKLIIPTYFLPKHYFGMITWPSWKRYILKYSRFLRVQLLGLPKNAYYYWQTLNQRKNILRLFFFSFSFCTLKSNQ